MADVTIEHDGLSISSNHESEDAMRASFATPDAAVETPDANASVATDAEGAPVTPAPAVSTPASGAAKSAKRETPQERIDKAVAKQREAERERDELKAKLAAAPAPVAAPIARPAPVAAPVAAADAADPDPEPNYVEGQPPTEFVKAHSRWAARQEVQAAEKRREQQWLASQRQQAELASWTPFVDRMNAIKTADPAFGPALVPAVREIDFAAHTPLTDALVRVKNLKPVLQYLSDHQDAFQRMATLHPADTFWEMADLDSRCGAAHSGPAPAAVISRASKPIQPVGGSPLVSDGDADDADLDVDAYIRRENKKDPRINPAAARR